MRPEAARQDNPCFQPSRKQIPHYSGTLVPKYIVDMVLEPEGLKNEVLGPSGYLYLEALSQ